MGRDDLIEEVKFGRMSPNEAEAEASRLGLEPFATAPDPMTCDPRADPWWTLPMTVAWIASREARDVLKTYDRYLVQSWHWIFREWRNGPEGPILKGHFLEQPNRATLPRLLLLENIRRASDALPEGSIEIREAESLLWKALQGSQLQASGIPIGGSQRKLIPDFEWLDLSQSRKEVAMLFDMIATRPWAIMR
jgi:hypothetical protein